MSVGTRLQGASHRTRGLRHSHESDGQTTGQAISAVSIIPGPQALILMSNVQRLLLHLKNFAISFAMSLLHCQEVSDEALEITEQHLHRPRCSVWEFLYIMSTGTLVRIICGMQDFLLPCNLFPE